VHSKFFPQSYLEVGSTSFGWATLTLSTITPKLLRIITLQLQLHYNCQKLYSLWCWKPKNLVCNNSESMPAWSQFSKLHTKHTKREEIWSPSRSNPKFGHHREVQELRMGYPKKWIVVTLLVVQMKYKILLEHYFLSVHVFFPFKLPYLHLIITCAHVNVHSHWVVCTCQKINFSPNNHNNSVHVSIYENAKIYLNFKLKFFLQFHFHFNWSLWKIHTPPPKCYKHFMDHSDLKVKYDYHLFLL
jgi:hypothetical protein